ncbi:MAG: phenylacetate-CoA oxygenase subunit PaaC [Acidimicrobiales bacterium]|nr:phenylacetate-CoA oxygenase subunit PaaC [Acidimicrobiales bacterium]
MMHTLDDAANEYLLGFADDELCVGQNHSWWIAVGPFLEEDLAFSSIAQDELGHARMLYEFLELEESVDEIAYGRDPREYRSAHIAELRCHQWPEALVRHVLYDLAEEVRWRALSKGSWKGIAAIATRAIAEERFHLQHALSLAERLLATAEGRKRLLPSFQRLAPMGQELFRVNLNELQLVESGLLSSPLIDQKNSWIKNVETFLDLFNCEINWDQFQDAPGREGMRSSDFESLHAEMVEVLSLDPNAKW